MLHLDVMTVTGKTLGENLEDLKKNGFYEHCDEILREKSNIFTKAIEREDIIHSFDNAKGTEGSIAILKGNLAPEGCVIKHTACPKSMFKAVLNARPYDSEEECIKAVLDGEVKPGDAIFIRYEGPRGSGMPEMFYTGEAICADPKLACENFVNALERIPKVIESHEKEMAKVVTNKDVYTNIANSSWKKEDELRSLKSEAAELDRKIALTLAPPDEEKDETEEKEQEENLPNNNYSVEMKNENNPIQDKEENSHLQSFRPKWRH